jgi:hypothetical protein
MMQMTKTRALTLLLLLSIGLLSLTLLSKKKPPRKDPDKIYLSYTTFAVGNGWGYDILLDNKKFIHQKIVPAVDGYHHFATAAQAEKVARLCIAKMKKGQKLPYISVAEIDSLAIEY